MPVMACFYYIWVLDAYIKLSSESVLHYKRLLVEI